MYYRCALCRHVVKWWKQHFDKQRGRGWTISCLCLQAVLQSIHTHTHKLLLLSQTLTSLSVLLYSASLSVFTIHLYASQLQTEEVCCFSSCISLLGHLCMSWNDVQPWQLSPRKVMSDDVSRLWQRKDDDDVPWKKTCQIWESYLSCFCFHKGLDSLRPLVKTTVSFWILLQGHENKLSSKLN